MKAEAPAWRIQDGLTRRFPLVFSASLRSAILTGDLIDISAAGNFFTLSLKSDLKRARSPQDVARDLASGASAKLVSLSAIERYGTRSQRCNAPPFGQNPMFAEGTWDSSLWGEWLAKCSLFERASVVNEGSGVGWRQWFSPPRIVRFAPYLNFSAPDSKNVAHFESACRLALLAYAAFPNSVWGTADELRLLPGAQCVAICTAFASRGARDKLPEPRAQWNECPEFIKSQWAAAKKRENNSEKANATSIGLKPPPAPALCSRVVAWDIRMGDRFPDRRIGGVARDLKSQGSASIVFLYGATPSSRDALQKSNGRRSMGLKPVIPLRPGTVSGARSREIRGFAIDRRTSDRPESDDSHTGGYGRAPWRRRNLIRRAV